jgi:2-dehydro-3-deoxyglucarate aldolase
MTTPNTSFVTENLFKTRLLNAETLYGGWATMGSTVATELLGHSGFDWVLIDGEHGANDYRSCVDQLLALNGTQAAAFIRPEHNDPVILKRFLDFGFYNYLIPMVETPEQAALAVKATRYPPDGIRGVSVSSRSNRFGLQLDYFKKINQSICLIVQIESLLGIENVEAIAQTPGIDCLFIGPQDIAASLGHIANPSANEVQTVIKDLAEKIRRLGKPVGILAATQVDAKVYRDWGIQFIGIGSDQAYIKKGAAAILGDLSS